jgi:V8-like Glu-specific endopeptidase
MTFRTKPVALVLALIAGLLLVSVASAGSNGQGKGKSPSHDDIVGYWTADRIAGATPRDISRGPGADSRQPSKKPDNPGGGNGGGGNGGGGGGKPGGGDSAVKGAPWDGTGAVQDTTGKILFTMGGSDYVCSGSVVNDGSLTDGKSIVLTAGHCVLDDVTDLFATNFAFMPDFQASTTGSASDCASTPHGCWTASALVTTTAWATRDFDDDYGFAVLNDGGGNPGSLEGTVGTQDIVFNYSRATDVHAFGYPHASPYDGTVLTYCAGREVSNPYGETSYGLKCDMTGGSSGGPWFAEFDADSGEGKITSLNSFKYNGGKYKSYMFGPTFDAYTAATFAVAKSAIADVMVPAP